MRPQGLAGAGLCSYNCFNNMKKIDSKKVLRVNYIKLGQNGSYTKECLEKGYIKLDYNEIDHNLCINGKWEKVREDIILKYKK